MASFPREAGMHHADAVGSVLPQSGHGPVPPRRAWHTVRRAGADHPHACRLVFIGTAPRGLALGMTCCIPGCGFCSWKWGSLFATSGCALWEPTPVPPLGQW